MFTAMPGSEINDDNDVMNIIAEKTGAILKETWLTGQTDAEAIGRGNRAKQRNNDTKKTGSPPSLKYFGRQHACTFVWLIVVF